MDIVFKQVNFLAELVALLNWYKQVRVSCIAQTPEKKFIYTSGLKIVELNFEERLSQLNQFIDSVQNSYGINESSNKLPKKEMIEQRKLLEKWPLIDKKISKLSNFEIPAPEFFKNSIKESLILAESNYTEVIKKLPKDVKKSGWKWLTEISDKVRESLF